MKTIIVYYSLEGNTDLVARLVADQIGADMIRLEPEKEIPKNGFHKFFWGGKSVLFQEKPKLLNKDLNLDTYDTLIIGTPIWADSFTPPINTFLSETRLVGKTIYLFATNAGGRTDKCFEKMKGKLEGNQIKGTAEFTNVKKMDAKELKDKVVEFSRLVTDNL